MWKLCEIFEEWNPLLRVAEQPGTVAIPIVDKKTVRRWFDKKMHPSPDSAFAVAFAVWERFGTAEGKRLKKQLLAIVQKHIPDAPVDDWKDATAFANYFRDYAKLEQEESRGGISGAPPNGHDALTYELLQHLYHGVNGDCIEFLRKKSRRTPEIWNHRLPPNDDSLLTRAIALQRRDLVQCLLEEKGTDVNQANRFGITPLLKAASLHERSVIQSLIRQGADVNAVSNMNANAIYETAFGASVAARGLIEDLVGRGVCPRRSSEDGFVPLTVAIWRGCNIGTIEFLLGKAPELIDYKDSHGETPFFKAFKHRRFHALVLLIQKGALFNSFAEPHHNGANLLFEATSKGDVERVRHLLHDGHSVDAAGEYERTPLHEAVENGHIEIVRLLLENGADAFAHNNHGRTPRDLAPFERTPTDHAIFKILQEAEKRAIESYIPKNGTKH